MNIISASRREDMPAFRMPYLLKRYKDFEDSFFVLWTKDPRNLAATSTKDLDPKRVALQLTVTGLGGTCIEPGVPSPDVVWDTVKTLIEKGYDKNLISWRFDPIIPSITTPALATAMADRAQALGITRCMISFIMFTDEIKARWPEWEKHYANPERQAKIVETLDGIMKPRGIQLFGCAQPHLTRWLKPARCIDGDYYAKITGFDFSGEKDNYQRKSCGCTESYDIGKKIPCPHGCIYCYAVPGDAAAIESMGNQLDLFK